MTDTTEHEPETIEERMRGLRRRLERAGNTPGVHREGIESWSEELAYYEALPNTDTDEARAEWADRDHIAGQLDELDEALGWEENRLGLTGEGGV